MRRYVSTVKWENMSQPSNERCVLTAKWEGMSQFPLQPPNEKFCLSRQIKRFVSTVKWKVLSRPPTETFVSVAKSKDLSQPSNEKIFSATKWEDLSVIKEKIPSFKFHKQPCFLCLYFELRFNLVPRHIHKQPHFVGPIIAFIFISVVIASNHE